MPDISFSLRSSGIGLFCAFLAVWLAVADMAAQNTGVYVGGHIRRERPATITKLKNSGFTYVILFNINVEPDGTLTTDGETVCRDGVYVFGDTQPFYANDVKALETIDTPADVEKCIVSHLDANANSNVYYTVEDGQIVKHVDTYVEYSAEATTVIYTKVELASGSASSVLGDVNGDGDVSVNDVAMIVNYILGITDSNFIIANADINGDGEIDINDVMGTVNIILEGDNTPQAYLTCPDNNHPHAIDLGLPSGTKWACCNVGAEKPEEYGGYYAWGETEEKDNYSRAPTSIAMAMRTPVTTFTILPARSSMWHI